MVGNERGAFDPPSEEMTRGVSPAGGRKRHILTLKEAKKQAILEEAMLKQKYLEDENASMEAYNR